MTAADMANLSFNMCHHKLNSLNQHWLSSPNLQRFADAMHNAGALLINCFGYLGWIKFCTYLLFSLLYCTQSVLILGKWFGGYILFYFQSHFYMCSNLHYYLFPMIILGVFCCYLLFFPWLLWMYFDLICFYLLFFVSWLSINIYILSTLVTSVVLSTR